MFVISIEWMAGLVWRVFAICTHFLKMLIKFFDLFFIIVSVCMCFLSVILCLRVAANDATPKSLFALKSVYGMKKKNKTAIKRSFFAIIFFCFFFFSFFPSFHTPSFSQFFVTTLYFIASLTRFFPQSHA